jgi:two-component system, chemotaxis family, protein-glutamate methylesterase/glutaminase
MYKAVIIGGSAGSFQIVTKILSALPASFPIPVLLTLHRLKHVRSGFVEALSIKSAIPVREPSDKEQLKPGIAYLAPSNYHMYVELGNRFALSTEEPVNHSRPSIDLAFFSAAQIYRNKLIGIILSGANKDGALGLKMVKDLGGVAIVQDPEQCQIPVMTKESMKLTEVDYVFGTEQIISFLQKIQQA